MKTNLKYTVIFSASQAACDTLTNLINTEKLAVFLEEEAHAPFLRSIGVYNGDAEPSFVVHTNSASKVAKIKAHVLYQYKQKCILVSHNRDHCISLQHGDGGTYNIGNSFKHHTTKPSEDCTVLNGTDFYTVY